MSGATHRADLHRRLEEIVREARAAGLSGELPALLAEAVRSVDGRDAAEGPTKPPVAGPAIPMRHGMVGDSPPMRALFDLIEKVAPSDVSVLVQGETGAGKELVARALHAGSRRRDKPFLAENCAAVPANLLESELFGHKRGSFTGAVADRAGHFVAADGGTVFLDEIGDMPLPMQSKLLRVLQEGEVRPVGSNQTLHVDVRVVAATNKDLVAMCRARTFREDLYYRLNVITITLPPLRERPGDVRHLVRFILASIGRELGREITISEEALAALERWTWPGNVRELDNVIRRAAVFSRDEITLAEIAPTIASTPSPPIGPTMGTPGR